MRTLLTLLIVAFSATVFAQYNGGGRELIEKPAPEFAQPQMDEAAVHLEKAGKNGIASGVCYLFAGLFAFLPIEDETQAKTIGAMAGVVGGTGVVLSFVSFSHLKKAGIKMKSKPLGN